MDEPIILIAIVFFVMGLIVGAHLIDGKDHEVKIANGELACEIVRENVICWNPKDEQ